MDKQPVKEETAKPVVIVERPEFMEPAPKSSSRSNQENTTWPTPKQKTE